MEYFEHLLATYGLPTAILAAIGWFLWTWGFNRSENEKKRGHFTKLMDQRIVNEKKVGAFMEVAAAFMEGEKERLHADSEWKQYQVAQCQGHVENLKVLREHQERNNAQTDEMIGELKEINKNLYDSDGVAGPAKRVEVTVQELSTVALELFNKPWSELDEDERYKLRVALERAVNRHSRNGAR